MNKSRISASMMCADYLHLHRTIEILEKADVELLHIDIMDGAFVPNFALGSDYIRAMRECTDIPLDIHMMVKNPENCFSPLELQPGDIVSIHYESTPQIAFALDTLRAYGCKCFLALSPETPISVLDSLLCKIDGINLLMVKPGFAGQQILPHSLQRAADLKQYLTEHGREDLPFEVDGNISPENAAILRRTGADMFVAGSSSIFHGDVEQLEDSIWNFRSFISDPEEMRV